jgi:ABC-type thiamine transport system ATPase subunit
MRSLPRRLLPLLLLAGATVPAVGQVDLTADPARTRGPAQAPVTIVEFSDFE